MKNLPFDYEYGYVDDALKACIQSHFESIIKKAEYEKQKEAGASPAQPVAGAAVM